VCPVQDHLEEHYVCQSITLLRPVSKALTKYLCFYLTDDCYGGSIWNSYIYGAGRPHLSFEQIKKTPVLIPPSVPQIEQLTARMESLESVFSSTEALLDEAIGHVSRLRQSILAKTFSGQLVPQDPNDEPASVLLSRIREERATNASRRQRAPRKKPQ
jgi:type I restriction enzyme S subunit